MRTLVHAHACTPTCAAAKRPRQRHQHPEMTNSSLVGFGPQGRDACA
jgi:hypothetical protein